MPTQDEVIARHLQEALRCGELQNIEGFGKPLPDDTAWQATPTEFRLPFKILKNSGFVPPEIDMFRQRGELNAQIQACSDEQEKRELMKKLSVLEQAIALRLEAMRTTGNL